MRNEVFAYGKSEVALPLNRIAVKKEQAYRVSPEPALFLLV